MHDSIIVQLNHGRHHPTTTRPPLPYGHHPNNTIQSSWASPHYNTTDHHYGHHPTTVQHDSIIMGITPLQRQHRITPLQRQHRMAITPSQHDQSSVWASPHYCTTRDQSSWAPPLYSTRCHARTMKSGWGTRCLDTAHININHLS
jgi:hypothetical protein